MRRMKTGLNVVLLVLGVCWPSSEAVPDDARSSPNSSQMSSKANRVSVKRAAVESRASIPADAPDIQWSLPPRPQHAPLGSEFQKQVANLPREQREAAAMAEILRGNVPDFFRQLKPIRVESMEEDGTQHVATYFVTSDYLSIGADEDFFRIPLTPATACRIADKLDASLITTKISDDLFAAAQVRLDPQPLTQDRDQVSAFWQHHQLIEEQLLGKPRGALVVGIKKDVVLSNRLREKPHKVAIYGWHNPDGRPIQSLYVGHVDWYVDYSHGIRLMSQRLDIDGEPRRVDDVLRDKQLCRLLSSEGPIDAPAVRKAAHWAR